MCWHRLRLKAIMQWFALCPLVAIASSHQSFILRSWEKRTITQGSMRLSLSIYNSRAVLHAFSEVSRILEFTGLIPQFKSMENEVLRARWLACCALWPAGWLSFGFHCSPRSPPHPLLLCARIARCQPHSPTGAKGPVRCWVFVDTIPRHNESFLAETQAELLKLRMKTWPRVCLYQCRQMWVLK